MRPSRLLSLCLLALLPSSGSALLVLEDGRSQVDVRGSWTIAWDSNVFNNADELADTRQTLVAGVTYDRNAGIIGVRGDAQWTFDFFQDFDGQNAALPKLELTLAKGTGRVTGNLELSYRDQASADDAANRRTRFREAAAGLTLNYPINERFSITSTTAWSDRGYDEDVFGDFAVWSQGFDGFLVYTSKLDLIAGYRVRLTDASLSADAVDHAFTVGFNGKLLARLDGSFRLGYQIRDLRARGTGSLGSLTATASFLWTPRSYLNVSSRLSKDFSTTSTALSADGFTWHNSVQVLTVRKASVTAGIGYSRYRYYELSNRARTDDNAYWQLAVNYPVTPEIAVDVAWTNARNWSTERFADYDKSLVTLALSAKY